MLLRSKLPFKEDETALPSLLRELDSPVYLLRMHRGLPWRNGAAVKLHSSRSAERVAADLAEHLKRFEMWCVHDAHGDYREPFGGRLGMHFGAPCPGAEESAQVFVRYKHDGVDPDKFLSAVQKEVREPLSRVLHLADGCVLMLRATQPLNVLTRRFEGHGLRGLVQCAAVLRGGETLSVPPSTSEWWKVP